MIKKKIKFDSIFEVDDLSIIGISSSLPDYRLVWCINNNLNFNFKYEDFPFIPAKQIENINFSFFQHHDKENFKWFYFLSNKSQNKFLISDFKSIDYLLFIKGMVDELLINETILKIKKIKNVHLTQLLDLKKIKHLDLILNDFELFTQQFSKRKNDNLKTHLNNSNNE